MALFQTKFLFKTIYSRPHQKPLGSLLLNFSFLRKKRDIISNTPQESGILFFQNTKHKLNVYRMFIRRAASVMNVLRTLNVDPVTRS